jgi:hypothetical protein
VLIKNDNNKSKFLLHFDSQSDDRLELYNKP